MSDQQNGGRVCPGNHLVMGDSRINGDNVVLGNESVTGALTVTGLLTAGTLVTKDVVTLAAVNGAVAIAPGTVVFSKAGVAAMTLAAPTAAQEGTIMTFIAGTANAHTLTATGLIDDGVVGGSKNLATFGAFIGASLMLMAWNLKWQVLSKNVCTIS